MQTNLSMKYLDGLARTLTNALGKETHSHGVRDEMRGQRQPSAVATVEGPSEKPPGVPDKAPATPPPPPTRPEVVLETPKTPEEVVARYGRVGGDPIDDVERPKSMTRPKEFKDMHLRPEDRALDYGDANDFIVDKYGKVRGEKTYENVFVNAASSGKGFGWTIANDTQREKLKMLQDMGMPRPKDLRSVSYFKLWQNWMQR